MADYSFREFGTLISFNPADFEKAQPAPRVLIEEVFADGHQLDTPIATDKPLRIAAGTVELMLRYTALQCAAPETLHFRYRLEDIDREWTEAGEQRLVTFRRLPPGSYRFRATASAAGGAWAEPRCFPGVPGPASLVSDLVVSRTRRGGVGRRCVCVLSRRILRLQQEQAAQHEFSRRLIESQEQERKRIAAELHDSLEQNLLVIKNRAVLALGQGDSSPPLKESLEQISSVSSSSIEEVRTIARNLRPHQLDRLGLARALTAMLRETAESSGLCVTSEIAEVKGLLTKEAEINLYRIVQESLNNIIKHAGATEAAVTLQLEANRLRLRIRDNGRGFDARTALSGTEGSGFGLAGMAERARLLGGQLKLTSEPGRGTEVEAQIPCSTQIQHSEIEN